MGVDFDDGEGDVGEVPGGLTLPHKYGEELWQR